MTRLICLILVFLALPCWAQPTVLISIDGMNRAFYQDPSYHTPELQKMVRDGASAQRMVPVFPSLTYPDHAALVTGCRPTRSGVVTNVVDGRAEWYWESRYLKATPIWKAAKSKGMRVALMGWPTTVGATVDYNIPEIIYVPGTGPLTTAQRIEKYSTPGAMELLGVTVPNNFATWDLYMTQACEKLLKENRVDLLLVHLIEVDEAQHAHGPDAPEVKEAIANVDNLVGRIRKAAGANALVAVVGDHGFLPYRDLLYPKEMLKRAGLTKARAHATGGSAAIYGGGSRARAFFEKESRGRYRIIDRQTLDGMGTFPGANFALASLGSVIFSYKESGPAVTEQVMGQHGHLPEMVPTGWLMVGPGIAPGTDLGVCNIVDVAPTLAKRIGVHLPQAEGRDRLQSLWFEPR